MPDMSEREIELKLHVPPGEVNRFRRSAFLRDHKTGRAGSALLVSTYFDTPDLDLKGRKQALRIRQIGKARQQTLKISEKAAGGLQERREFNAMVAGDEPDIALIGDDALAKQITKLADRKGLKAVFSTEIRRTTWQIAYGDSMIEVALDLGRIVSGDRQMPVSEIELELVEGKASDVVRAARAICGTHPFTLDQASKAARGYALFLDRKPDPAKGDKVALSAAMTPAGALARILQSGIAQVLENVPVVRLGEDPEGVHQARVGVRRLRSALPLFKPFVTQDYMADIRDELRWLQQELGPARDFDVFLETSLGALDRHFSDDTGVRAMIDGARAAQAAGYVRANAALSSPRFTAIMLTLDLYAVEASEIEAGAVADVKLKRHAGQMLDKRLKNVMKAAGKKPYALAHDDLHPLRLELKKLRYATGFFQSLYDPGAAKAYGKTLSRLQDCLGALNDALVQRHLVEDLAAAGVAIAPLALGRLEGWNGALIEAGLSHLKAEWKAFSRAKPFWR